MRLLSTLKISTAVLVISAGLTVAPSISAAQDLPPRVVGSVMVDELTAAPMQFEIEVELTASPADVFGYVSDSMNIDEIVGAVEDVALSGDGATRDLTLSDGTTVTETIVVNDAGAMSFAYSLPVDNPMGLSNHLAVIQVRPADERDGAVVAWQHYFDGTASDDAIALYVESAANLVERFGGYSSGINSGFGEVSLFQTRIFDVSAQDVWAEVAENYANAHLWASAIASIEFVDALGGHIGDLRACFIPGLGGSTREVITRYDEDAFTFAYTIEDGMPPFVTSNEAVWSIVPLDEETSQVNLQITFSTAPDVPPQPVAFTRSNFFFFAGMGIDELKYYLENGEPHPREIASRS